MFLIPDYSDLKSIKGKAAEVVNVTCNEGFTGGGKWTCGDDGKFSGELCKVEDECSKPKEYSSCHEKASCTKTKDSYTCACNVGYTGDGKKLQS